MERHSEEIRARPEGVSGRNSGPSGSSWMSQRLPFGQRRRAVLLDAGRRQLFREVRPDHLIERPPGRPVGDTTKRPKGYAADMLLSRCADFLLK
jgi:hypothetical protein